MNETKNIPFVIITNLLSDEFNRNWGSSSYGQWICEDEVIEFTELSNVFENNPKTSDSFIKTSFSLPSKTIMALVIKGNTREIKPHQLEIVGHLLMVEKCKIGYILIHSGGGTAFKRNLSTLNLDKRRLCNDKFFSDIDKDISDSEITFTLANNEILKVKYFNYSLGGGSEKDNLSGQYIVEISKAIKCKVYKDATENLINLYELLNTYKNENYNVKELQNKKPKQCLIFEIIKKVPALFLPIYIDITGLWELSGKASYYKKENVMNEFVKDMLKDKESLYYSKKLAEARFLVIGKSSENSKDAKLKETLLKFPDIKKEFVEAFGYRAEDEIKEVEDYEKNLKEDSTFMVSIFFRELDSLIEKCGNPKEITYADISTILGYYERFINWFNGMNLSFLKLVRELNKV